MPFPNEPTQFQPGRSGNPDGYSQGRRFDDQLRRLVRDHDLLPDAALTVMAMALGRHDLLIDPRTGLERKPDIRWMHLFVERHDGPLAAATHGPSSELANAVRAALIEPEPPEPEPEPETPFDHGHAPEPSTRATTGHPEAAGPGPGREPPAAGGL